MQGKKIRKRVYAWVKRDPKGGPGGDDRNTQYIPLTRNFFISHDQYKYNTS